MDSSQIPRVSAATDQLSQLSRPAPVTRGTGDGVKSPPTPGKTDRAGQAQAPTRDATERLFALEEHVPIRILQNPQLLKAEWAWKLLVFQQLAMGRANMSSSSEPENASQTEGALEHPIDNHQDTEAGTMQTSVVEDHAPTNPTDSPSLRQSGHPEPPELSANTAGADSVALGQPTENEAETAVRQLWRLLTAVGEGAQKRSSQVQMNLRTDPPILPFASMNHDTIALAENKSDASKVERWVVEDRLVAGVLDNPYERTGAGLFFTPPLTESAASPHQAVKWQAQRQTRIGAGGKLIHRLRLELEVHGKPLTCIVTAQRPQLLVHFVSEDKRLLGHLERGESVVQKPLQACGWELIGWTAGSAVADNMEESL